MKKGIVEKAGAVVITIFVLGILFLSVPAQAFTLGLDFPSKKLTRGDNINFKVTVKLESNDEVNVTTFLLRLIGPFTSNCKFDRDGNIIIGCKGMTIEKVTDPDTCAPGYGYCYNYGNKKNFHYKISLDTTEYYAGKYRTSATAYSGNKVLTAQEGDELTIDPIEEVASLYESCSIRAKDGNAYIEDTNYGQSNKLNFYLAGPKARKGEGFVNGQKGRTTYNFKFKVNDIIDKDSNLTIISVTGKYKVGIGAFKNENAVIVLNKKKSTVNIIGENVNIAYMNINFMNGCEWA
ncbi:MAG: hypothetical protein Q8N99_05010 [Nanoarchaeota archaeon]|nr:hypothetical protein [Nanoarchaeota archaeon]